MPVYSKTPLAAKLGIKEGSRVFLWDAPGNYLELVDPVPPNVAFAPEIDSSTDIIHIFSMSSAQLSDALQTSVERMRRDGVIWVSWPKMAAKVPTDITEGRIREIALPMGLVDIKVCAVNEVWSGLKLVVRKELRRPSGLPGAKQRHTHE